MKIIIASTIVPFIEGGGTFIVDWLEQKLKESGHQVDVLKIPFSYSDDVIPKQMLALRRYHVEDACDRLISVDIPAGFIRHMNKYILLSENQTDTLNQFIFDGNAPNEDVSVQERCIYQAWLNLLPETEKIIVPNKSIKTALCAKIKTAATKGPIICVGTIHNAEELIRRLIE